MQNKNNVHHLLRIIQGIGLAGLLFAQAAFHVAWAGPVTWYLDNIRFDSGATATGSFTYDPEPFEPLAGLYGTYSNININVNNANGTVNEYRSVNPASRGNDQYLSLVAATAGDLTGVPFLALTPAAAMTATGGAIDILPGPQNLSYQGVCRQSNCGPADAPYEEVLAGGRIIGGPQVWTMENLQFDSGATASGYFFFDSDTGTFPTLLEPEDPSAETDTAASVNGLVTVTRNGGTTRFRVVNPATGGNSFRITLIEESIADLTDRQILVLNFLSGMTNRGGTIGISTLANNSYLGICANAACDTLKEPFERALAGAQIVSAPNPSTWYLEGVQFDNGATASGSFKYGIFPYAPLAGLYGTYADINIQVSNPNGTINEYRIVNPASRGNQKYVSIVAATGGDLTGRPFLALTPAESMIGSNRSIPVLPGPQNLSYQGVCRQANCGPADSPYQEILAGGRISQQTLTPPAIVSSAAVSVSENQTGVIDVEATDNLDSEGNGLVYSKTGGADQALFNLNTASGVVTFIAAPNFENAADVGGDNVYNLQVTVTDFGGLSSAQDIAVTVTDVAEDMTPPTASPTFEPAANAAGWHNNDVTITWNWLDGAGGSGINPDNCTTTSTLSGEGALAIVGQCSDLAGNLGLQGSGSVNIDKTPPETTILASPDAVSNSNIVSFSFEGADTLSGVAGFECELQTPQLSFGFVPCTSPHVYSGLTNDGYLFQVRARDVAGLTDPSAAGFNFAVDSTNQPPVFTSPNRVVVDENQILAINIQSSDDADSEGAGLVYNLAGGDDQSAFTLDSTTGVLSFLTAPDFEDPQDSDGNNTFEILISLTDSQGLLAFQQLVVEVRDIYEPDDGELISVPENQVTVINAENLSGAAAATAFTISGGADQSLFNLDATTGDLVFITQPDYERPKDAGGNNQYSLEVTVSNDSGLFLVIRLTVEVLDVDESICFFIPTTKGGVTVCL